MASAAVAATQAAVKHAARGVQVPEGKFGTVVSIGADQVQVLVDSPLPDNTAIGAVDVSGGALRAGDRCWVWFIPPQSAIVAGRVFFDSWHDVENELGFASAGWVNNPTRLVYRLDAGGHTMLSGSPGGGVSGTNICILPAPYQPGRTHRYAITDSAGIARLIVHGPASSQPRGAVQYVGTSSGAVDVAVSWLAEN